jgi:vesicle-fusing ATPase
MDVVNTLIAQARESTRTPLVSCLLTGRPGVGKTALAAKLAVSSGFPLVKLVTPDDLVRVGSEQARCGHIVQAFEDAYKSELSIVILDNVERMLDYVPLGPRFSNAILQTLLVLVRKPPPKPGRKMLVLATTSNPQVLRDMELYDSFDAAVEIPPIHGPEELRIVMSALRAGGTGITSEVIEGACHAFPSGAEIPVKRLIMLVEMARQYRDPLKQGGLLTALAQAASDSNVYEVRASQSASALAIAVAAARSIDQQQPQQRTPDVTPPPGITEPHRP